MTSGYQYLKEKVEKLTKDLEKRTEELRESEKDNQVLRDRNRSLENEAEALVFNRMVKGIREITGWQEES